MIFKRQLPEGDVIHVIRKEKIHHQDINGEPSHRRIHQTFRPISQLLEASVSQEYGIKRSINIFGQHNQTVYNRQGTLTYFIAF